MNDETSEFLLQGTLNQLQSLQEEAQRLSELQNDIERNNDSLEALRQQRDKLQAKLNSLKQNTPTSSYHTKSLADILLAQDKSQSLASGIVPSVEETPSKRSTRQSKKQIDTNHHSTAESRIDAVLKLNSVSQSARQIEVLETLRMHRLTGRTVFPIDTTTVGIRFETFFKGKYYECYYVILRIRNNGLKIYKHTIPSFIPIDEIAKLLNKNIKKFLNILTDELNAYVARREQIHL